MSQLPTQNWFEQQCSSQRRLNVERFAAKHWNQGNQSSCQCEQPGRKWRNADCIKQTARIFTRSKRWINVKVGEEPADPGVHQRSAWFPSHRQQRQQSICFRWRPSWPAAGCHQRRAPDKIEQRSPSTRLSIKSLRIKKTRINLQESNGLQGEFTSEWAILQPPM